MRTIRMLIGAFAMVVLVAATMNNVLADGADADREDELRQSVERVQQQLKMTFTGLKPEFLGPSPVRGVYELLVGDKIIYYAPEAEMLFFGEFYTKNGVSHTQQRLGELQRSKLDNLPIDQAIKIGNGPNKIIEFTDLDCPFCRQWENYASQRDDITRYVFLMPVDSLHPVARAKSIDALCSDKPGDMVGSYLRGERGTDRLIQCAEGKKRLAVHEAAAQQLGVRGTPTLVINGTLVSGFNRARIQTLLDSSKE